MPRPKKIQQPEVVQDTSNLLRTLKGFRDILPQEQKYWEFVYEKCTQLACAYGFSRLEPPILEDTSLFVRSVGKMTDIVSKEMFSFIDTGGENVSLRPEATASIARAYIEHGMINQPQPVKIYYWGPMFRRERPQAGRYRQFWQFGVEVMGSKSSVIDAQLISFFSRICQSLGLSQIAIHVNSIGCDGCRNEYKKELVDYYKPKRKQLCEDCKKRLVKNPLRILDCKIPTCQALTSDAPQILDFLDDECRNHFMSVLEYLDGMEISYVLNPFMVRGLDYYTRTVFEIYPSEKTTGNQSALGGGGRYDNLVKYLGGQDTPSCGFSAGIERIILELKERGVVVGELPGADIFLAQIGEQAKITAFKLFEKLRESGFRVAERFSKDGLKLQLEAANKLKVRYALILGQKEVLDGTILVRDMESGVQEIVGIEKIIADLKKKLEKNNNAG